MGSRNADPKLLRSSGMKGCPPQVFRVFCVELPCQTLWLRPSQIVCTVTTACNVHANLCMALTQNTIENCLLPAHIDHYALRK